MYFFLQKVEIDIFFKYSDLVRGIHLNELIGDLSINDVTSDIVRKATKQIKPMKNDAVFAFNSDCLKGVPPMLFQHLANIFKSFLIDGHVITYRSNYTTSGGQTGGHRM